MTAVTHDMRVLAASQAIEFLRTAGHPELIDVLRIEWRPFRGRLGDALLVTPRVREVRTARVRLSATLWPHSPEHERRATVGHEIAHIVTVWRHQLRTGSLVHPQAHGPSWRRIMAELGLPPERCHRIRAEGVNVDSGFRCGCGVRAISIYVANRIRANRATYTCRRCRRPILTAERYRSALDMALLAATEVQP